MKKFYNKLFAFYVEKLFSRRNDLKRHIARFHKTTSSLPYSLNNHNEYTTDTSEEENSEEIKESLTTTTEIVEKVLERPSTEIVEMILERPSTLTKLVTSVEEDNEENIPKAIVEIAELAMGTPDKTEEITEEEYIPLVAPPATCSTCHKTFANRNSLRSHKFRKHGKEETRMAMGCPFCDKTCKNKSTFYSHKYRYHKVKPTNENDEGTKEDSLEIKETTPETYTEIGKIPMEIPFEAKENPIQEIPLSLQSGRKLEEFTNPGYVPIDVNAFSKTLLELRDMDANPTSLKHSDWKKIYQT